MDKNVIATILKVNLILFAWEREDIAKRMDASADRLALNPEVAEESTIIARLLRNMAADAENLVNTYLED